MTKLPADVETLMGLADRAIAGSLTNPTLLTTLTFLKLHLRGLRPKVAAQQALVDAVAAWRAAKCIAPRDVGLWSAQGGPYDGACVGEEHGDNCPCEVTRQAVVDASTKLEEME